MWDRGLLRVWERLVRLVSRIADHRGLSGWPKANADSGALTDLHDTNSSQDRGQCSAGDEQEAKSDRVRIRIRGQTQACRKDNRQ